jgi:RNA polymerase sigma-70 factor (ECF subfamily)
MEQVSTPASVAEPVELPVRELDDFDSVVRQYWPRVFRFALVSLRDRDAAQSVAQDCFLRAWRSRQLFRGDSALATWLMRIAVNLVRDHARNRRLRFWSRAQASMDLAAASRWLSDGRASAEECALRRERIQAVWEAAQALPQRQRTVFLLRFVEEMDLLEIAAATGLAEGTVKTHLFRALETVRQRFGGTP